MDDAKQSGAIDITSAVLRVVFELRDIAPAWPVCHEDLRLAHTQSFFIFSMDW